MKDNAKEIQVNDVEDISLEEKIKSKVAELKKKHRINEVFVLESNGLVAYVKRPSRDQLKYAMSVSQNDPLGLTEHILESGWLEGDDELKTEDRYFLDISRQIDEIIETTTVSLKKY